MIGRQQHQLPNSVRARTKGLSSEKTVLEGCPILRYRALWDVAAVSLVLLTFLDWRDMSSLC